jgi:L-rhamnose mutarotase
LHVKILMNAQLRQAPGPDYRERSPVEKEMPVVKRLAFTLLLGPANVAEYQRRHDHLWPELRDAIRAQGGSNFSIFYDEQTERVFCYLEVDNEERWSAGAQTELTRRWWRYMAELMPTNADHSPIAHDLREVFHQD